MKLRWQINLLFISQLVIVACLDMSDPYWPLIFQHVRPDLDMSQIQFWTAINYIFPCIMTIIVTPLWSQLGQKIGHKKMVLRAGIALALSQLLIGFVTNPLLILLIRVIQGIFSGFTAAAQSWSLAISRPDAHGHIMGRMQAATAVGTAVGPIIGGLIASYTGYSAIFTISAMLCMLMIFVLAYNLQETTQKEVIKSNKFKWTALPPLEGNAKMVLGIIGLTQAARWMSSSFFALYVIEHLSGGNLSVGILYSSIALAIFLAAPQWGQMIDLKVGQTKLVKSIFCAALICAGISQYLFAFSSSLYVALFSCLLLGISYSAISLIPYTFLIKYVEEGHKNTIIGLGNSVSKMGNVVGVTLGAYLMSKGGFAHTFIAIGIIYCGLAILSMVWLNLSGKREEQMVSVT